MQSKRKSKLRLDTEAGAKGDLGGHFAIVPGDVSQSELIRRVTSDDLARRMPPAYAGAARLTDRRDRASSRDGSRKARRGRSTGRSFRRADPSCRKSRTAVGQESDRFFRAGPAGAGRPEAFAGSRPPDPDPPRVTSI